MTGHDDFDRTLAGWFEADALPPAPTSGLDQVLDATRRRRPRPAWLAAPGSHWVGPDLTGVRGAASWSTVVILMLIIVALVGGAILVGARLLQPSPPPRLPVGELAYGLDGDIYVADWDGKDPVRIADGAPGSTCGSNEGAGGIWSPNGRYLAYRSSVGDPCAATVVIADPISRTVVSFPGEGWELFWSPDSTRVATWLDFGSTIGVYGVDGVRQAMLTVPVGCAGAGDYDPRWSFDGTSLIGRACEVPVDGQPPHTLPTTDPRSHGEAWAESPNGAHVAYNGSSGSLVDAPADGSESRVLIPSGLASGAFRPVWSPTGDRIAFTGAPPTGPGGILPDTIGVVDVASGTVTLLASASGTDTIQVIGFSPDGDRILFARMNANLVGTSLWSVQADGSNTQLLETGTGWGEWQP